MDLITKIIRNTLTLAVKYCPTFILKRGYSLHLFWFHNQPFINKNWRPPKDWPTLNNPILLLGHSNFLNSTGGTELTILQSVENLLRTNKDFIYLFPEVTNHQLTTTRSSNIQIIVNGHHFGTTPIGSIQTLIDKIKPQHIEIHHTLRWPQKLLQNTLNKTQTKKYIYLHDFLWRCPLINSRCLNGEKYCTSKVSTSYIKHWKSTFAKLLELCDEVIVPSKYVLQQLPSHVQKKTKINEPKLSDANIVKKPTIAYLGYAAQIKGYDTWIQISKNALITRRFNLIHIGDRPIDLQNIPCYRYNFSQAKNSQAVEILKKNDVAAALLWSQVPESYSFTLKEALEAKCKIITSTKSGNIAYTIKTERSNDGVVLNNDYDLTIYLLKEFSS